MTEHEANTEPAVRTHIQRVAGTVLCEEDWIASETPLEIRIGNMPMTVLMRTPGNDEELVRGFFYSEGIIQSAEEIVSIVPGHLSPEDVGGTIINVQLAAHCEPRTHDRAFYSNSSCGICGKKTIASLEVRGAIAQSQVRVRPTVLNHLPEQLRSAQTTFAKTGGVHASGLFTTDGQLIAMREDVGRHNALDKLVGWGLKEGKLPFSDTLLLVSGRVSYELVQKAVVAGIPLIASVGAPSSLAVDLAQGFGLTLVGFLKQGSMNIYSHAERIQSE
jgi:FdhD protein